MANNEYREPHQTAREVGLEERNRTRHERAIARDAIERSAPVYVLRQFEALLRNRVEPTCQGELRHRAELDLAVLGTLWEEAWMNGYVGDREIGDRRSTDG